MLEPDIRMLFVGSTEGIITLFRSRIMVPWLTDATATTKSQIQPPSTIPVPVVVGPPDGAVTPD
jgi:hypothetical protein